MGWSLEPCGHSQDIELPDSILCHGRRKGLSHSQEEAAWFVVDHVGTVHLRFSLSWAQ